MTARCRRVQQTIFGEDGNPKPGATVTASYTLNGQWVLESAQADNDGKVLWKQLPPAPVIVWGTGSACRACSTPKRRR